MLKHVFGRGRKPTGNDIALAMRGALVVTPSQTFEIEATKDGTAQLRPTRRSGALPANDTGYSRAYSASVWAFRCLNVRAQRIGDLLSRGRVLDADGTELPDHPLLRAFDLSYRHFEQDFFLQYVYNKDLFGEAYVEKVTGIAPSQPLFRLPMTLKVLPSLAVMPLIMNGEITGYQYNDGAQFKNLTPDDVVMDRRFNPRDTLRGLSLLEASLGEVNVDIQIIRFDVSYFANGTFPGLVIAPKDGTTFNDADYERLKAWISEKLTGASNAFRTLPLTVPMDITPLQPASLEDQTHLSDDMRDRICAGTGVPVGLVDHSNSAFQLSPEQAKAFAQNTTHPEARGAARFVTARLLPFFDSRPGRVFDIEQVLTNDMASLDDPAQKEQIARSQFESGRITFNESRAQVGQAPVEGGDFYAMPVGRGIVRADQLAQVADIVAAVTPISPVSIQVNDTTRPQLPAAPRLLPASTGAAEAAPDTLASTVGLNGAQIDAAMRVLAGLLDGSMAPSVAVALLASLGIDEQLAQRMVNDTLSQAKPALTAPAGRAAGKASFGTPSGTAVLYLSEVEDVLRVQQSVMQMLPADAAVRWTPVGQLHITLAHTALIDEPVFRDAFQASSGAFAPTELRAQTIARFDGDDAIPLVLLVEPTDELMTLQRDIYDALARRGVAVSQYSRPDAWKPHITLGYLDQTSARYFEGDALPIGFDVTFRANVLAFTRGDYIIVQACGSETSVDDPPQPAEDAEFRAWRRHALRKGAGKAVDFQCYKLDAHLSETLRRDLALLNGSADKDEIAAVFDRLQWRLLARPGQVIDANKAIQATRLDFEGDFEDLLVAARGSDVDRRTWSLRLRTLLRKYGERAFRDGLRDGGVTIDDAQPLDDDDQANVNRLLTEQGQYVTSLGAVLFERAKAISDNQADLKPAMWFNKSVYPLYEAGRLSADANGMYLWVLGRTEAHCETCSAASTQIHRLRDWYRSGVVPKADVLACGGFQCDCKLIRTTDRAKGRLSAIPRSAA